MNHFVLQIIILFFKFKFRNFQLSCSFLQIAVLTGRGGMIKTLNFCPADRGGVRYLTSVSEDGFIAFWEYVVDPTPKLS